MATIDNTQLGIDFSKKKKKRSSKKKTEETADATQKDELELIEKEAAEMFGVIAQKKKKKSKRRTAAAAADNGVADEDDDDVAQLIDQLKTTKVTKRKQRQKQQQQQEETATTAAAAAEETSAGASYWDAQDSGQNDDDDENIVPETPLTALERMKRSDDFGEKSWTQSDRDYLYEELLDRIFTTIQKQNPELGTGTRKKFRIKPPQIAREPKKTIFVNFREICENIRRDPDHVISYLYAELGTTGSIDSEYRLIIKGIFSAKNMEIVLKKYIAEYVGCRVCGSLETLLKRDPNTRLFSINCLNCSASRTVSAIRQGFLANTTPRRRRK